MAGMLTKEDIQQLHDMEAKGMTYNEIRKETGYTKSTIKRHLKQLAEEYKEAFMKNRMLIETKRLRKMYEQLIGMGNKIRMVEMGKPNRTYRGKVTYINQNYFVINLGLYKESFKFTDLVTGDYKVQVLKGAC